MRTGANGGNRMKKAFPIALTLLLILALVGCGRKTGGKEKKYTLDQFKTLVRIRARIKAFESDLSAATQTIKPTNECLARIRKVISKYEDELPPVALTTRASGPPEASPFKYTPLIKGTETGTLLDLYQHGISPAGDYLLALVYLYGVEDFVSFVKQHLLDYMAPDGNYAETVNPNDPPQESYGNWYYYWPAHEEAPGESIVQEFGAPTVPIGITIKMVREVTGVLTYYFSTDTYTPYNEPFPSHLWMAENAFSLATESKISSGDRVLLDNLSI